MAPFREEGLLKRNVKVWVHIFPQRRGGSVTIGYDPRAMSTREENVSAAKLAHWINYGHWWTGHLPAKTRGKFIPGTHFMDIAFEYAEPIALDRFESVLTERVNAIALEGLRS